MPEERNQPLKMHKNICYMTIIIYQSSILPCEVFQKTPSNVKHITFR